MTYCHACRHHTPKASTRNANPPPRGRQWTLAELMATQRLVNLVRKRHDVADLPLIGARLAAGALENA